MVTRVDQRKLTTKYPASKSSHRLIMSHKLFILYREYGPTV